MIKGSLEEIAFAFYAACVEDFLKALGNSSDFPEDYFCGSLLIAVV
jgi:hypothetical protein